MAFGLSALAKNHVLGRIICELLIPHFISNRSLNCEPFRGSAILLNQWIKNILRSNTLIRNSLNLGRGVNYLKGKIALSHGDFMLELLCASSQFHGS